MRVLLVVQPSLSHYRESFVKALKLDPDINLSIAGRYSKKKEKLNNANKVHTASSEVTKEAQHLERIEVIGKFFWDKGLFRSLLNNRSTYNLVILEGNFYNLTTWITALFFLPRKTKVAFWGHGWKRDEAGVKLALRKLFYSLPAAHFVYGNNAVRFAEKAGIKTKNWFVIYNSLYSVEQLKNEEVQLTLNQRRKSQLIFSGRLTKRHGVDLLVTAVLKLRSEGFESLKLVIVGDGSEREALIQKIQSDPAAVEFVGAQHEFGVLKKLYGESLFAVSPGASGLNVVQALGFGLPVVAASGDSQSGPEIEAVQDGVNGFLFQSGDLDSLIDCLRDAFEISDLEWNRLSLNGINLVNQHYNAGAQAEAMAEGIKVILK